MTAMVLSRRASLGRANAILPIICFALVALALRSFALQGEASQLTRTISGWATLAGDGKVSASEMVAAYPPLPLLMLLGLHSLTGFSPENAEVLSCALLATLLGTLWLRSMRKAGDSLAIAASLTFLLIANPLFLRLVAAGPQALLVTLAFWIFARTAFSLRRFGDVDAMMLCSVSLILMVMSGPFGSLVALLCSLGITIAFPREISWRHRPAVLLALLFPVVLAVAGLVFVNWLLMHDSLAFVPDSLRFGINLRLAAWGEAPRAMLLACLCCPIVLVAAVDPRTSGFPIILLAYILFTTSAIAIALGLADSPALAISLAIPLAAVIAEKWGREGQRLKVLAGLLGLGLFGGFIAVRADIPRSAFAYPSTVQRAIPRYARNAADAALARHIAGRSDVMFDAAAHPAVVAARGSARGLVTRNETAFQLALLRRAPRAQGIVVEMPDPSRTADAVSRAFPDLYANGAQGYELEYDRDGWRVWTRRDPLPQEPKP